MADTPNLAELWARDWVNRITQIAAGHAECADILDYDHDEEHDSVFIRFVLRLPHGGEEIVKHKTLPRAVAEELRTALQRLPRCTPPN